MSPDLATPGCHVVLLPQYRHHYDTMGEDMFVIEERITNGKAIMLSIEDAKQVVNMPASAWGMEGGIVRMRSVRGDTYVHAPVAWICTAGEDRTIRWEERRLGDRRQEIAGKRELNPPPVPQSVTMLEPSVIEIAKQIAAREARIMEIAAERNVAEIQRLTQACAERNLTINTIRAELERERSDNLTTLRGLLTDGGMFLSAKEVAFIADFLDGFGKLYPAAMEQFEGTQDDRDALYEKLIRLKIAFADTDQRLGRR